MKQLGSVEVPQEAFMAVLSIERLTGRASISTFPFAYGSVPIVILPPTPLRK